MGRNVERPIRIAICSAGELFGGVERHILGLIGGLQAAGVTPTLILFNDAELAAQVRDLGIIPVILSAPSRAVWKSAKQLADMLQQRDIELVHAHGYKATVFCALARRYHRFAALKTVHGLPEPIPNNPLIAARDRLYHFLDHIATRTTFDKVFYVTEELRSFFRKHHAPLPTSVLPNGIENIDQIQFDRPPEFRENCFNLVIVGRVDTVKGHQIAIDALVDPEVPKGMHLHIIGTGPLERALHRLTIERGISERVHFLGFRRNVYDYLAHSDVLLMPSTHEGLPYTLLEAMALGKPIIASAVGGIVEITEDRISAIHFPVGDSAALSNALKEIYHDPHLRSQLGEHAQRIQRANYSLETMTKRYIEEYCLLSRKLRRYPDRPLKKHIPND